MTIPEYAAFITGTYELSDEDFKEVRAHVDHRQLADAIKRRGTPLSVRDIQHLTDIAGDMPGHKFEEADQWDDEILQKYAEYVYNYEYTYKPEAQQLDPSIDPNETHIGPMAQDLEKVNPATVVTDPSGYKKVDTQRLALMNAGAIASLAREIAEIKQHAN